MITHTLIVPRKASTVTFDLSGTQGKRCMRVEVYGKPVEEEGRQYFLNLQWIKRFQKISFPMKGHGKFPRNEGSLKLRMSKESLKLKAVTFVRVQAEKPFVRGLWYGM